MAATKHLAVYLNDHLAGSKAALELLDHLKGVQVKEVAELAGVLYAEVSEDRHVLESLMERLEVSHSTIRQASAWLGEKLTLLKLRLDDPAGGDLHLLESLEALSLGIEGKRLLWLSFQTAAIATFDRGTVDYNELIRRAEDQRARVEQLRRDAASKVLTARSAT